MVHHFEFEPVRVGEEDRVIAAAVGGARVFGGSVQDSASCGGDLRVHAVHDFPALGMEGQVCGPGA